MKKRIILLTSILVSMSLLTACTQKGEDRDIVKNNTNLIVEVDLHDTLVLYKDGNIEKELTGVHAFDDTNGYAICYLRDYNSSFLVSYDYVKRSDKKAEWTWGRTSGFGGTFNESEIYSKPLFSYYYASGAADAPGTIHTL